MKDKDFNNLQKIGFLILLAIFLVLAFFLFWPFFKIIFLAIIAAIIFLPLHNFLSRKLKNNVIPALLIIISILVIVAGVIYFLGQATIKNTIDLYGQYKIGAIKIDSRVLINNLPIKWQNGALYLFNDISKTVGSWINSFNLDFQGLLSNIASFVFSFFLFFLTLFYLLKDHEKIKTYLNKFLPLSGPEETLLIARVTKSVNGVVRGDFLIATLQGIAATTGFMIAGLPQPLFFGFITIMAAFVPVIGTSVIIIPAVIYLLLFKSLTAGLILAVWYILIHLSIDNIIGPKLIGSRTNVHSLLILFSLIGGIELFGVSGFLFGPIIITILASLVDIYLGNKSVQKIA